MRSMLLRFCFADRQPRRLRSSVHFSWRLHSWSLFSKDYPTPRALLSQPQPLSHSTRGLSSNIRLVTYTYCLCFCCAVLTHLFRGYLRKYEQSIRHIFVDPPEKNSLSSSPANDGTAIFTTTSSRYLRPHRDLYDLTATYSTMHPQRSATGPATIIAG
jgi:hypothetical protein